MNIKIANRLLEYRKRSGLTQEELADKLNISRQSVSKWERAESSPDTDNLIELAKIYGVTLDDLLNVEKPLDSVEESAKKDIKLVNNKIVIETNCFLDDKGVPVVIYNENSSFPTEKLDDKTFLTLDDLYIKKNGEKIKFTNANKYLGINNISPKTKNIVSTIQGVLIFLILIVYILLCSLHIQEFGKFWIIFVCYPILSCLVEAIAYKKASKFPYPIFATAVYLTLGLYFNLWHPGWVVFITVPVYYLILSLFTKKTVVYYCDSNNEERYFKISDDDIYYED